MDDKFIAAWTGHPHLRVIDNSTDFEDKMKRLIAEIASFLLRVEKLLPHVALQALQIKAQKDPEAQSAEIVLEWPAKGELSVPTPPQKGGAKK